MINIPLPFHALWLIMLAGVLTNVLAKINFINQNTSEEIPIATVVKKFFRKEWASYGMSIIFTLIVAYSFIYMKKFETIDNEEITKWAKWIPLAVIILYLFGILNQYLMYKWLGRIQSKGNIDVDILKEKKGGD